MKPKFSSSKTTRAAFSSSKSGPQKGGKFDRPAFSKEGGRDGNPKAGFRSGGDRPVKTGERTQEGPRGPSLRPSKGFRAAIGIHAVNEVLRVHPKAIQKIYLRQGWESSQELKEIAGEARALKVGIEVKSERDLETLGSSHQGLAALIEGRPTWDWQSPIEDVTSCVLVLDGIEDVHNLGAIVRTSWLMGAKGILIPEDRAVGITPTVHKVACGGMEHVPVESVVNFSAPIESLKEQGFWVFGLSHKAKKSIFDLKMPERVVWAIGAEDKGLRVTTERLCDELVSIPQMVPGASYNASVATAMALMETHRQQHFKKIMP